MRHHSPSAAPATAMISDTVVVSRFICVDKVATLNMSRKKAKGTARSQETSDERESYINDEDRDHRPYEDVDNRKERASAGAAKLGENPWDEKLENPDHRDNDDEPNQKRLDPLKRKAHSY